MYNLLFGVAQVNDVAMMRTILTTVIQKNKGAITATVDLEEVEKVGLVLGAYPIFQFSSKSNTVYQINVITVMVVVELDEMEKVSAGFGMYLFFKCLSTLP